MCLGKTQLEFLSAEDAVEYLQSIWDEEEELAEEENISLNIIPPPADAASDREDVDDDAIMIPECSVDKPTEIAGTVKIMLRREDDDAETNNESLTPPK